MSYSISNVLAEAGLENILRWVPFDIDEGELRNRIKNKMIRPTTVPCLLDDLKIEQAIAREALRLAFQQHKELAVGLKGVQRGRTISESFDTSGSSDTIINMKDLDLLIGSGGVLSHAPRRSQAMMMLIDAFGPEAVTRIAVDSIFMMPHLGVLAQVHEQAATEVFKRDCLIHLGTCVACRARPKSGKCFDYRMTVGGQTRRRLGRGRADRRRAARTRRGGGAGRRAGPPRRRRRRKRKDARNPHSRRRGRRCLRRPGPTARSAHRKPQRDRRPVGKGVRRVPGLIG